LASNQQPPPLTQFESQSAGASTALSLCNWLPLPAQTYFVCRLFIDLFGFHHTITVGPPKEVLKSSSLYGPENNSKF